MKLFRAKQLPVTSYGYRPPPGAHARGWHCISDGCGAVGDEVPRQWPFPCRQCGGPTDPALPEPWRHEARGTEIQHLLTHNIQDGGFTEYQWPLWRFKEALRVGDRAAARQARGDFRDLDERWRSTEDWWVPGSGYVTLVWDALEAGDLDSAADDLVHWLSVSNSDDVENHNSRRTNCRQVLDGAMRFFGAPGGPQHPQAASIRQGCLALAAGAYPVLGSDVQAFVTRLAGE